MTKILRYLAGTPGQLRAQDAGAATKAVDVVSVSTVAATTAKEAVDVSLSTVVASTTAKEAVHVSVSTVAATAVDTGHLALKVEGYSWLKEMHGENGRYIESSAVEIGGHTWTIRCYLNGDCKEGAGWISLYLHLSSDSDVVRAEFELALVRHHGPWPESGPRCALIKRSRPLRTFEGKNNKSTWGWRRFIKVKGLERHGFLKDDSFTVRCTVTVVEERTAREELVVPADDMARLMGMLCKCDDDRCKREHARRPAETFMERFANICYCICRGTR